MAKHLLHVPQVDAPGHEVRREAVPERVGADVGRHAGAGGMLANHFPDPHPREPIAP
jgi:hypothetical protein